MLDIHSVDFFECTTLTLYNKEVNYETTDEVASRENVSITEVDGRCDERCEERDQEVPSPVAGSGKSHSLRAVFRGVNLSNDSPNHWAPCCRVPKDKKTGENDEDNAGGGCVARGFEIEHEMSDGGEDHETYKHPNAAGNQRLTSTIVLD